METGTGSTDRLIHSNQYSNIAFIGARGAGKSKLTRKLSKVTGLVTMSTDNLVSYEAGGESIESIVKREGWKGFRNREYETLAKIVQMKSILIDCGGGILVEAPGSEEDPLEHFSERKANLLKENSFVIYIHRSMNWLLGHKKNASRPDLTGSYSELLQRRIPWYESVADYTLNLDGRDISDAVAEISPVISSLSLKK